MLELRRAGRITGRRAGGLCGNVVVGARAAVSAVPGHLTLPFSAGRGRCQYRHVDRTARTTTTLTSFASPFPRVTIGRTNVAIDEPSLLGHHRTAWSFCGIVPCQGRFASSSSSSSSLAPPRGGGQAAAPSSESVTREGRPSTRDEAQNALRRAANNLDAATASPATEAHSPSAHLTELPLVHSIGEGATEILGFMKPTPKDASGKTASAGLPCDNIKAPEEFTSAQESMTPGEFPSGVSASGKPVDVQQLRAHFDVPDIDKKEMWKKIRRANTDKAKEDIATADVVHELEWARMEKEIKEEDRWHWRIGQLCIDDEQLRRDYLTIHYLMLKLNRARWSAIDVQSQKQMGKTGANLRLTFWKESCLEVVEKRDMPRGQFVDSHPVLRPFADVVRRHKPTKMFLRGCIDQRVKIIPQPANIQQLFDYYDRFYGYCFVTLLEILGVRQNDIAEHLAMHMGRAHGLVQHGILLWREYARKGMTLLPADICADNHVNLALLKNIPLAERDRCVRKVLFTVAGHAKAEMDHVRALVAGCPNAAWPVLLESFFSNYYLRFLEAHDFNVGAWFSDQMQYSPGFYWYGTKKMFHWSRKQDLALLVSEEAPNPLLFWKPVVTYKEKDGQLREQHVMGGTSGGAPS